MDAFKSAVTNYFHLPHWFYTPPILYITLLYYYFIITINLNIRSPLSIIVRRCLVQEMEYTYS